MASRSPKLPWWRRWFGNRAERAATKHLKGLGCRILARNVCSTLGELDVVALDGKCIVFVEVRSTEGQDSDRPAASVGPEKQQRLTKLAVEFLQKHRLLGHAARFDVLTVSWPPDARRPHIEHYKNAFEAVGRFQLYT